MKQAAEHGQPPKLGYIFGYNPARIECGTFYWYLFLSKLLTHEVNHDTTIIAWNTAHWNITGRRINGVRRSACRDRSNT
jgi:hypothetical protein